MASNNVMLSAFEQQPWQLRSSFNDTFENECLTNALYKSFTNTTNTNTSSNDDKLFNELVDSLLNQPQPVQTPLTPTISGASENEVLAPKRRRSVPPPTGKVSKRKSRASKRSTTTFITADPANFRRMVQEVTGVRFNGETPLVLKPEANRAVNQIVGFDASSFLLDSASFLMNGNINNSDNNNNNMVHQQQTNDVGVSGFGFESFCSFPTLESWKV